MSFLYSAEVRVSPTPIEYIRKEMVSLKLSWQGRMYGDSLLKEAIDKYTKGIWLYVPHAVRTHYMIKHINRTAKQIHTYASSYEW